MSDETDNSFEDVPDFSEVDPKTTSTPGLTVKDMAPDSQPRERAINFGIGSLTNAELLALILRSGAVGYPITSLCQDFMKRNENLFLNIERLSHKELIKIRGIGETKALQIEAVMEIVRRYNDENYNARKQVTSSLSIYKLVRPIMGNLPHEEMWAVFLNRSNHVIGKFRSTTGGSTATLFDKKKIIRQALIHQAEGVILCHNHPSGNPRPSGMDDNITAAFREACKPVDLRFLDHIIVTASGYYSYADSSTKI